MRILTAADDQNWKSSTELIRSLVDIASKGGNYLLNVGPTASGRIPEASIERLRDIGAWMEVNGEAIYRTQASPFEQPSWGRFTQREPTTLYAHVFDWPAEGVLSIPDVPQQVESAVLLTTEGPVDLRLDESGAGIEVHVPANPPSGAASVIRIEFVAKW